MSHESVSIWGQTSCVNDKYDSHYAGECVTHRVTGQVQNEIRMSSAF